MSVEHVSLIQVYDLHSVDFYPDIEMHVPEMVISDFPGDFPRVAVPVAEPDIIEVYPERIGAERPCRRIFHIGVRDP